MVKVRLSDKGQITLPASLRRKMGLRGGASMGLDYHDGEIVLRPLKSVADVAGFFADHDRDPNASWEEIRTEMERAVARQVANE